MVDIEIVREWLAKADEDFEFAPLNLEEVSLFLVKFVPFSASSREIP